METTLDTIVVAVGAQRERDVEKLVEATLQIAVPTGARVILAHVFSQEEFTEAAERLEYPEATVEDVDAVLGRHRTVREFAAAFDEHDVEYEVEGAIGDITEKLVAITESAGADRLVIAGHRRSPTGKAVFGSLSQEILLEAPCPVTYVKVD